jgi:hypothetical protein
MAVFKPTVKITKRWKDGRIWYANFLMPAYYNKSHITVSDNTYGIKPLPIRGRILTFKEFCWIFKTPQLVQLQKIVDRKIKQSGAKAFIYVIAHPVTKIPLYVGSTVGKLTTRLSAHYTEYTNPKKKKMLNELRLKGRKPIIDLLCICPVEFRFIEEARWKNGAKNKFKLCNIQ